ncbi:hypothetical protein Q7M_2 [Borrelia crocidurae str. Achema]|uniref:Uncharacterized protein n=1 Tax=Borrelia crocidurae (strain Achema) TaxID=1155096 RepID=I0FBC5_BORCA|nr:hypothetical protein Q7M_2 [Borrelia crocidurae str. Achema]
MRLTENFTGYLLANSSKIKYGDRLLFNKYGMLKKVKSIHNKNKIIRNVIALSDSVFDEKQGHYLVKVKIY